MRVTMMLADAAQAVEGKLYILGGGWSQTPPELGPSAIALHFAVPWDQTNVQHRFDLELLDSDGGKVTVEDEEGVQHPLLFSGEFEVGRPPGVKPGVSIDVPMAINLGPMSLPAGNRFVWRLTVDGKSDEDWRLPFSTESRPQGTAA